MKAQNRVCNWLLR